MSEENMSLLQNNSNTAIRLAERGKPALWGGIECSITRVKGNFQDQLNLSGHYDRPEDIELIAGLGVRCLRFPILFEKHMTSEGEAIDWTFAEDRLKRLRENNIKPVVGLVHHGSGPVYTNLLSRHFATQLAKFASQVAARFPDIEYYTPVNEPLTTARFSGLYGLWYPHHSNGRSFCKMLLNELAAVVLSMQEIRKINPAAKLVQTEELGKVYALKNLQYQADFENERRWITFDILCGRVDPDHFLWQYFIDNGISRKELEFFLSNPCPPDIAGVNYYVTSERFLDDNLSGYPPHLHGGNHIEKYVDTEAVRVDHGQPSGLDLLLRELHERYSLPIAVTEAHLHCTREEQMRWFKHVWDTCCNLARSGIRIEAVTAWSLFGAFGWNKLLTSPDCDYEPGVFDLRAPKPRPTAMARMIKALASGTNFEHSVLSQPGWWQRKDRFISTVENRNCIEENDHPVHNSRGVLIVGDNLLAEATLRICNIRALPCLHKITSELANMSESELDLIFKDIDPWAVIFTGTDNKVLNEVPVAGKLARYCRINKLRFLLMSSLDNLPLNGKDVRTEDEGPLSDIEVAVLGENPSTLIARSGVLFGPWDKQNIAFKILTSLRNDKRVRASEKTFCNYSYVPDFINAAMDLMIDEAEGICHLAHAEYISHFDFAGEICKQISLPPDMVLPSATDGKMFPRLRSEKLQVMPALSCAIDHFVKSVRFRLDDRGKLLVRNY